MRITWVDNAKAIGILAIVVGHDPAMPPEGTAFLYAFHIPLFFVLSGYLTKPRLTSLSLREYVRRNARRLLVPYVFFWTLSLGLWMAFRIAAGSPEWHEMNALAQQFYGLLTAQPAELKALNAPLWFYTALFMTTLVFFALARAPARWVLPSSLLPLALLGVLWPRLHPDGLPWNLTLLGVTTLFFVAGYCVKRSGWLATPPQPRVNALVCVVCALLTLVVAHYNGRADTAWAFFGESYLLYLLGSFTGTFMVLAGAALLPGGRVLRFLSENTLGIFSIHFPLYFAFAGIGEHLFGGPHGFPRPGTFPPLVYPALALALCVPACLFLRRYLPWTLGLAPTSRPTRRAS